MVSDAPFVARAQGRAYLAAGLFAGFFVLTGFLVTRESAQAWPLLAVAGAVAAVLLAGLAVLRLEVGPRGIRYRSLTTRCSLRFEEIERAYFETVVNRAAPQGLALFWIRPKQGKALRINLRVFSDAAPALLLAALERHGISIDIPDTLAARRMAHEVGGGGGGAGGGRWVRPGRRR